MFSCSPFEHAQGGVGRVHRCYQWFTWPRKQFAPDEPQAKFAARLRELTAGLDLTLALDVQWPAGEPVTLFKFQTGKNVLDAWRGKVISSPACPPAGGCATRVLVKLDGVADVCSVHAGPHPILYCGDFARHAKTFAQLYGLEARTNG